MHFETWQTGILGPISISGLNEGKKDLTWQKWNYQVKILKYVSIGWAGFPIRLIQSNTFYCQQVGLKGEVMNLVSPTEAAPIDWIKGSLSQGQRPLTWYKVKSLRKVETGTN